MHAHLEVSPARRSTHGLAAEVEVRSPLLQALDLFRHPSVEELEETARLRRQLVERAAEDFGRETVGGRDVLQRRLDVLDVLSLVLDRLHLTLVLDAAARSHG